MIDAASVRTPRALLTIVVLALLAAVPIVAPEFGNAYYITIFIRVMIWSIAAVSLNLILGYGGMVSFGHAAYIGLGGYVVGIFAHYGVLNGFLQWPVALAVGGLVALMFGAIALRTRGVYFIMITLALAQMIYFLGVSVEEFGSDDGMNIADRSHFGGLLNLDNQFVFYYFVFASLLASLYLVYRIVNSRFGMVIRGAKSNEARMEAIGFPVFRYKLTAFVVAGVMCAFAGILQANFEKFVSPDMMQWTRSGDLIFMVVLGGMGSLIGPVAGSAVFIVLADTLSNITRHWHIIFGPFLIFVVLFARRGIDGLFGPPGSSHG